ncbi:actin binding methyltransferase [Schizosaccharomyces octosporus yFS286]|uniref:tRNA N(3)-methylcytidine methyltransferase n=1 Tax=Schizosaccharomyces octosporus (strain yFS286) TaxID=483514 RepID=S9Q2Z0_SCHOY|nr:actin binding methyltransferase [Schizosaccharomyces octosporus yFS286]EPX74043.1 actin binding methyltransferase [Schizosaccharomyces octosporus yFS286]
MDSQKTLGPFWAEKYKRESKKSWDKFYKRNETRFFRDRHWLDREFDKYFGLPDKSPLTLLEVGCGVGNLVYPLLEVQPNLRVLCCDFSPRAIEFVKKHENFDKSKVVPFVCDITEDRLDQWVPASGIDTVTAIFVLSALPREKQQDAIRNLSSVLKVKGHLVFRDYCDGDFAQKKFQQSSDPSLIDERTFVRQDGTISYFFIEEELNYWMENSGLRLISLDRVNRKVDNRKRNLSMDRTFLQGVWEKCV